MVPKYIQDAYKPVVIAGAIIMSVWGFGNLIYKAIEQQHIKSHLEQGAFVVPYQQNVKIAWSASVPRLKNKDINGNGLYETLLIDKTQEGQLVYVTLTKDLEGRIHTSEPQPFKK